MPLAISGSNCNRPFAFNLTQNILKEQAHNHRWLIKFKTYKPAVSPTFLIAFGPIQNSSLNLPQLQPEESNNKLPQNHQRQGQIKDDWQLTTSHLSKLISYQHNKLNERDPLGFYTDVDSQSILDRSWCTAHHPPCAPVVRWLIL